MDAYQRRYRGATSVSQEELGAKSSGRCRCAAASTPEAIAEVSPLRLDGCRASRVRAARSRNLPTSTVRARALAICKLRGRGQQARKRVPGYGRVVRALGLEPGSGCARDGVGTDSSRAGRELLVPVIDRRGAPPGSGGVVRQSTKDRSNNTGV